jgi:hypothetical protein
MTLLWLLTMIHSLASREADMSHVSYDMSHVSYDMSHVSDDTLVAVDNDT